jgi:formylglycine-generating enzyme required for sulfatase activity
MSTGLRVSCAVVVLSGSLACVVAGGGKRPAPDPVFTDPTTSMELVRVKGGCFQMGNTFDAGGPEEAPAHEACVEDFYLGRFEVTQGQWKAVMGTNPSQHSACGDNCPVEMVSWDDVQDFIRRLNGRSGGKGPSSGPYRLPTEAEWEYAARSGGRDQKYSGQTDDPGRVAWYHSNSEITRPVGLKAPNDLGLHDMTGNVWEWTGDWYGEGYYAVSPRLNPAGPASGDHRVLRGGSFGEGAFDQRASFRNHLPPDYRGGGKGFRLLRNGIGGTPHA